MARKCEFVVPTEVSAEFVEALTDRELENTVTGVTEDHELIIEVSYVKDEVKMIDELETILDSLISELEDEDDEDDEEEDEDDE